MDHVSICLNIQCSTYVFGASSEACPNCGLEGKKMSQEQADHFTRIYREVQAS